MTRYVERYAEVLIRPHYAGFGEWDSVLCDGPGWATLGDLLSEITDNVGRCWHMDDPDRPEEIPDIRGSIHNEPEQVWCYWNDDDTPGYFGIAELYDRESSDGI